MLSIFARWRSRRLLDRVSRARDRGVGVYYQEWHHAADPASPGSLPATIAAAVDGPSSPLAGYGSSAAAVLAWCRETLGATRRPWGIANFDLALAATDDGGTRTLSMRWLAPSDLYPGESLLVEVQRFLGEHAHPRHLTVALFSWGDATHEVLGA